jgi:GMP synthase-like glutamine amidotransferase
MHRDVVAEFPAGSEPLARTELCPVQGMYVPKKYITVQGHPEFNADIVNEILTVRHMAGIFSDQVYEDALKRVAIDQDGPLVAKAFLKFMRE